MRGEGQEEKQRGRKGRCREAEEGCEKEEDKKIN